MSVLARLFVATMPHLELAAERLRNPAVATGAGMFGVGFPWSRFRLELLFGPARSTVQVAHLMKT